MKKALLFTLSVSLSTSNIHAQEITAEEKETMLAKIETMESKVLGLNQSSQQNAIATFRAAMTSDTAAFKLYMDCKKAIDLEEKKKKISDVQEDMRKFKEKTSKEFKRALKYQLFWLVYSLEAARNPDARMQSAQKLVECLANIVNDAKSLNRATTLGGKPLKQDPFSSVFAKAYKVDHLKPESWPSSPLDFGGLYKGLIMQDLIERGELKTARQQWMSRLHAERSLIEAYADDPDSTKFGDASVALEKYLEDRVPVLMWEGEQILYNGGDKRNAVIAMFGILEKYPTHPNYLEWIEWFKGALGE